MSSLGLTPKPSPHPYPKPNPDLHPGYGSKAPPRLSREMSSLGPNPITLHPTPDPGPKLNPTLIPTHIHLYWAVEYLRQCLYLEVVAPHPGPPAAAQVLIEVAIHEPSEIRVRVEVRV